MHNITDYVQVVRTAPDELSKKEWDFWFDTRGAGMLYLNTYTEFYRETTRHKFKESSYLRYDRLSDRRSTITPELVTLPDDVIREARKILQERVANVHVGLWTRGA